MISDTTMTACELQEVYCADGHGQDAFNLWLVYDVDDGQSEVTVEAQSIGAASVFLVANSGAVSAGTIIDPAPGESTDAVLFD